VRGGGERGFGRSRGTGTLTGLATFVDSEHDESVADSNEAEEPMSAVIGCALTKSEEVEPGGSENGSLD
jgi:hypothetical protein